jgi:hypothetical protein
MKTKPFVVTAGTYLRNYSADYMVVRVRANEFIIVCLANGNRWVDTTMSLKQIAKYAKANGFTIA